MADPRQGEEDVRRRGVTRRGLFRGAGIAAASGALLRPLDALADEAEKEVRVQGPEAVPVALTVNGQRAEIRVEPRTTLLDALRGPPLALKGTKPVCDRATCGACTVWLDGELVLACSVLAVEAEGREVTTVEGLGSPDRPHAVQRAFVEEDAAQCGFCTPGMVMSAAWAVEKHGKTLQAEDVRHACAGNLCRCGTYPHVVNAALRAAKEA